MENCVLSRAGIGSYFDQFRRKLHKLSQQLVHIMVKSANLRPNLIFQQGIKGLFAK